MAFFVDVHAHLTHEKFNNDRQAVLDRCQQSGMGAVIVNGLEPKSNRTILEMAKTHDFIKPALGIYPIDAVNNLVKDLPFRVSHFNVDEEIAFIRQQAETGQLIAIGECGLDGYWVTEETFARQEQVFLELVDIAMACDIPVIIHTRKLEKRSIEILKHHGIKKVNFHCFGGKVKLALNAAEHEDWCFSIPANARVNQAFTKMLKELPEEKILTETDCPFLSATKGKRSEPKDVMTTVSYLAELRGWSEEQAKDRIWKNFCRLFNC